MAQCKQLTLSDVETVYDDFQVDENEEIDFDRLVQDIDVYKSKRTASDPEKIKVKQVERNYNRLAKEAKALTYTEFSQAGFDEGKKTDETSCSSLKLLDRLDFILQKNVS